MRMVRKTGTGSSTL